MEEDLRHAKCLYNLFLNIENFCQTTRESEFDKNIFSVKFKILFLISEYKKVSPSVLVEKLQMAKSNVALFCKQLLLEGYIKSNQDDFDHRILYYGLTKKGEEKIKKYFQILQKSLKERIEENKLQNLEKNLKATQDIFLEVKNAKTN